MLRRRRKQGRKKEKKNEFAYLRPHKPQSKIEKSEMGAERMTPVDRQTMVMEAKKRFGLTLALCASAAGAGMDWNEGCYLTEAAGWYGWD
jgi:hypothetical protein